MKLRHLALACVLLFALMVPLCAIAEDGPTPLSHGCGSANITGAGYLTVDTTGRLCGSAIAAPYQYTSAGAMQSQVAVTTSATVALTVPSGATVAIICLRASAGAINYSYDGTTTPTTTATGNGLQLAAGSSGPPTCVSIHGATLLANFSAIGATATTAFDAAYLK